MAAAVFSGWKGVRMRRKLVFCLALFFIVTSVSYAAGPLAVLLWTGRIVKFLTSAPVTTTTVYLSKRIAAADAQTIRLWKAGEISATLHAAALTAAYVTHKDAAENSEYEGKATISVTLNDKSPQRDNPDPETWDDAQDGKIEPTPKQVFPDFGEFIVDDSHITNGYGSVQIEGDYLVVRPEMYSETSDYSSTEVVTGYEVVDTYVKENHLITYGEYNARYSVSVDVLKQVISPIRQTFPYRKYVNVYSRYPSITTPEVEVFGMKISDSEFNSKAINSKVVYVDASSALRMTWTRFHVSGAISGAASISDGFASYVAEPIKVCYMYRNEYDRLVANDYAISSICSNCSWHWDVNPHPRDVYYDLDPSCSSGSIAKGYYSVTYKDIQGELDDFKNSVDSIVYKYPIFYQTGTSDVYVARIQKGYVHQIKIDRLCESGQVYDLEHSSCVDSDVMKPATLPCEIININGEWKDDPRNPNCEATSDTYDISGNNLHIRDSEGEMEIVRNDDGTYKIRYRDNAGNWNTINTGDYSESDGAAPLLGVIDSPTGGFVRVVYGGNGEGEEGDGEGGSCGGVGQVPCAVDDSGFEGMDSDLGGKFSDLDAAGDEARKNMDDYDKDDNFGFEMDWFPNLWPDKMACEDISIPLEFNKGALKGLWTTKIEFCDKASDIRQFVGWLVYLMTALYLWRRLTSANSSGGVK